jgi:hypothetical protein
MAQSVIHQPRVAWDAACAFIRAAGSTEYETFADRVYHQLGVEIYGELGDTRQRLLIAQADLPGDRYVADVEAGKWRVRFEELMRQRPDLVDALRDLSH